MLDVLEPRDWLTCGEPAAMSAALAAVGACSVMASVSSVPPGVPAVTAGLLQSASRPHSRSCRFGKFRKSASVGVMATPQMVPVHPAKAGQSALDKDPNFH